MKTPSMRLILKDSWKGRANQLKEALVHRTLGDVVSSVDFVHEPSFFESAVSQADSEVARRVQAVMEEPAEVCPWVGRIVLDAPLLLRTGLTPGDVACRVAAAFPLHVAASDESDEVYLLRLRPILMTPGSTQHPAGSLEEGVALRASTEALVLRACRETVLHGIRGISSVTAGMEHLHALDGQGDFQSEQVAVLETQGGSLASVLAMDAFRAELCTSNDVHNVYHVLGVEAAATVLFEQIKQTLQFDGSYTNERHLMLLCSFCTHAGSLLPISRHGINRSADAGALSRASFEEVTDQLLEAATYGDSDHTAAFSPAIMVGQRAPNVGTGICYAMSSIPEESVASSSEDEVVFTAVDADIEMLSYQQDVARIEAPYSDAAAGIGLPAALQHSFIAALPNPVKPYAPSSPKNLLSGKKRPYEPSSPRGERRLTLP